MGNKKKYIVITPFFPSDNSHVGSYIYDQVKTIIDLTNYDVKVIKVASIFSFEKDYFFKGIEVKIFKMLDFPFFIFPGIFNWVNSMMIKKFFNRNKYFENLSIIHAHVCYPSAYLANAIKYNRKVKTIIQHHGIDVLQLLNGRFSFLTKLQNDFIRKRTLNQLNMIDLNVSVSNRVKNELHTFDNYKPKKEYILYNGVDRFKFYPISGLKKTDKFQIGCVANFWKIKDQISLIKAVEIMIADGFKDVRLRLIGEGVELEKCKKYVLYKKLEKYIFFEKQMKHENLNNFYNELDLFVLPSYYEALGCVYLEAWAANIPVISVEGQGFSELVSENEMENLIAKKQSPESLKDRIFEEYKKRRIYVFNEKYDIRNTISEFVKLYL